MKEIPLTKNLVAFVDDEDFKKVSAKKWRAEQKKHDAFLCPFPTGTSCISS